MSADVPPPELLISKEDNPSQQQPTTSASQQTGASAAAASSADMCLKCHTAPIQFAASGCGHKMFCKKCAMKCATGGKCKVCGQLYPDLRRI